MRRQPPTFNLSTFNLITFSPAPNSPSRVLLQLRRSVHLAQLDLQLRNREQEVPIRERLGAREERPSALLVSAAFAVDEAVDGRRGVSHAPSTQIEQTLTFHRELEPALGAHCRSRIGLTRERRIGTDLVRRPLDRR